MRQKTKFVRGSPAQESEVDELLLERLNSSMLDSQTFTNKYAKMRTKGRDVRTEAIEYLIKNRNVLNA